MNCCLDCDWLHTVRNQALQELFFYLEEEESLKQKLKFVRKNKRDLEKRYNELWEQLEQRNNMS
jgi:chaperonin cofactor prefoldin